MCEDIRRQFEKHLHPELDAATYVCLGVLSWIYLLFAIQVQDIKRILQGIASCYCWGIVELLSLKANSLSNKSVKSSATNKSVKSSATNKSVKSSATPRPAEP